MACKKSEIAAAINSFATARATNDPNLIAMSGSVLQQLLDTLEFSSEEVSETEVVEDTQKTAS
jgi:hypothetical protein